MNRDDPDGDFGWASIYRLPFAICAVLFVTAVAYLVEWLKTLL